jgi:hypothetical protein
MPDVLRSQPWRPVEAGWRIVHAHVSSRMEAT